MRLVRDSDSRWIAQNAAGHRDLPPATQEVSSANCDGREDPHRLPLPGGSVAVAQGEDRAQELDIVWLVPADTGDTQMASLSRPAICRDIIQECLKTANVYRLTSMQADRINQLIRTEDITVAIARLNP
ncbi:hypothetical protein NDU88_006785 [Pleurodeles waltl]|uniref:Uncharacterized protein n=1 Tax=Pleurodeles waltl TaxID=8319 RepID=A0AAV7MNB6_PLEWA|nr:hypothetical protein NDU88_006785 [Pleurodeles waltl]